VVAAAAGSAFRVTSSLTARKGLLVNKTVIPNPRPEPLREMI
jgi:hypothetical protein